MNNTRDNAPARMRIPVARIVLVVILAIVAVLVVRLVATALPIQVTVNGQELSIRGDKTVRIAAKQCGVPLNPGDLISLHGSVLQKGAGHEFSAVVNGEEASDLDTPLHEGDIVEVSDGADIVEDYNELLQVMPHEAVTTGVGALHVFEGVGMDGMLSIRTGKLSGETLSKTILPPQSLECYHYNPNVEDEKVLALTFDGGPSVEYTEDILDVLAKNGAHATFFFCGNQVEDSANAAIAKRAANEGHQVCSHTYSDASDAIAADIGLLDVADQIEEVQQGQQAIAAATGTEISRTVRLPGGSTDATTMENLQPYLDMTVGWNTDCADNLGVDADSIANELLAVTPGDILLLHDGGGDCQATVDALARALPQLKNAGWSFVTIQELEKYPPL